MLEVEVKLAMPNPKPLKARLKALKAKAQPAQDEADTFFQHPTRDFGTTDEALRLRRTGQTMELTYKGPRQAGRTKTRKEYNIPVGADPTALLKALGFMPNFTLLKTRQRFTLDHVTVCIDDVEGLGSFVEVEALGEDRKQAEAHVESALEALGLADVPREERSYLRMALEQD